jgi:hypothetical protein
VRGGPRVADHRVTDARLALAHEAREIRHGDLDFVRRRRAQELRDVRDLRLARRIAATRSEVSTRSASSSIADDRADRRARMHQVETVVDARRAAARA